MSGEDHDLRVARYLDGEMSAEERKDFEKEIVAQPGLAAQLARWGSNDDSLRAAFDKPFPEDLERRLGLAAPAELISLDDVRARRTAPLLRRPGWLWASGGAIAAGFAFLLYLGVAGSTRDGFGGEAFQVAMTRLPSARTGKLGDGRPVTPQLTFRDGQGRFCREFALGGADPEQGIACLRGRTWQIEARIEGAASPEGEAGEYRTAGGTDGAGLDPVYQRLGASDPLDGATESALIRSGWRKSGAAPPARE